MYPGGRKPARSIVRLLPAEFRDKTCEYDRNANMLVFGIQIEIVEDTGFQLTCQLERRPMNVGLRKSSRVLLALSGLVFFTASNVGHE